ncbi:MAG TPA: FAD-dependent oxidoreductase, partial [Gemmatimonadaceae bacterium]|nr:FAD-dependent oxidoreductase [Gemmatimonadaceae bacterium]
MSTAPTLSGPDFTKGVPAASITAVPTLGQVEGQAVLLTRIDGVCHAVGATCTHYGAPLVEGLVADGAVRCPWHHACFSLRTGETLRAPALFDLPRWRVEERDGLVFVREPITESLPRRTPARRPESVVIVGAGAAGNAAAETLRREGYDGPITMVDPDPSAPVDRPNLSKDYLAGTAQPEWIPLHDEQFYHGQRITLVRARVTRIDADTHTATLDNGQLLPWGALILATGADPVRLAVPNAGTPVYVLRTLADSNAIIAAATAPGASRVVVVGASFIGLEVAASLRARGLAVHVVAPEARPLERVMGPAIGDFIRSLHEEHGVTFHLGHTVRELGVRSATLDDDTTIAADFVVAGIGVRPAVSLASWAKLDVSGGVVVDEYLETNVPGIFAAGDIARWPDRHTGSPIRVEHWVLAERQGQVAARNVLGAQQRFDAVPFFWSQHYDVTIAYVGHAERWDQAD